MFSGISPRIHGYQAQLAMPRTTLKANNSTSTRASWLCWLITPSSNGTNPKPNTKINRSDQPVVMNSL